MIALPLHFRQARLDVIVVHGGAADISEAEAGLHSSLSGWATERIKESPHLRFQFRGFSCFHPEGFPSPIRALGVDVSAFMPLQATTPTADVAAQNLLIQVVEHFQEACPGGSLVAITRFPVSADGLDEVGMVMMNVANFALASPSTLGTDLVSMKDLQKSIGAHRWEGLWSSPEALVAVLKLSVTPLTQDRWDQVLAPARQREMEERWPRSPGAPGRPRI